MQANASIAKEEFILSKGQLVYLVTECYYRMIYTKRRLELLERQDSLLAGLERIYAAKVRAGDVSTIEQSEWVVIRHGIEINLNESKRGFRELQTDFSRLLYSSSMYFPSEDFDFTNSIDTISLGLLREHPLIKRYSEQETLAGVEHKLARAKLFPEISLGYFNQSLQGTGADNKLYASSDRFGFVQVGLEIPLFGREEHARVRAAGIKMKFAQIEYKRQADLVSDRFTKAKYNYISRSSELKKYQDHILPELSNMRRMMDVKLSSGDIAFAEHIIYLQTFLATYEAYELSILHYQLAVLDLRFLTTKSF